MMLESVAVSEHAKGSLSIGTHPLFELSHSSLSLCACGDAWRGHAKNPG